MKRFTVVSGICVSLVLGAALSAVGQDEHPSERPPNAPQEPKETRPEPAQHQDRQQEQEHTQQPAKPDDRRNQQPESGDRKNMTPQSEGKQPQEPQNGDRHMQGQPANQEQRQAAQGQSRHIPDKDFHSHFGQSHHFAVGHLQTYQGRPSFAYSGYTFVLVQAWPAGWVYDDDNCYIDYIDGDYWLFNVLYPGVRVELFIVE